MFSMTEEQWKALTSGEACPFCSHRPEGWLQIATLATSTLYLRNTQTYRGYAILAFDPYHATRLSELSSAERERFWNDVCRSQSAIERATKPDHMNIATLGNQVPHLHWHIIPRYKNDPRWGGPIWTTTEEEMVIAHLPDQERRRLADAIRAELV